MTAIGTSRALALVALIVMVSTTVGLSVAAASPGAGAAAASGVAGGHETTRSVTFSETGLIPGTLWCVSVEVSLCSVRASISFHSLAATTLPFSISPVAGYTLGTSREGAESGGDGSINLTAKSIAMHVRFAPALFAVTFNETGLAVGSAWHVRASCTATKGERVGCAGMAAHGRTKGSEITLWLRNGTYSWSLGPLPKYEAWVDGTNAGTGTVTVNGSVVLLNVTFIRTFGQVA